MSSDGFNLSALEVYSLLSDKQNDLEQEIKLLQSANLQLTSQLNQLAQTIDLFSQSQNTINQQFQIDIQQNATNINLLEQRVADNEQAIVDLDGAVVDNQDEINLKLLPMYDSAKLLFFDSVWKWSFGVSRITTNGVGTIIVSAVDQTFDSTYWHICDGSVIPSQYSLLRSMVGTRYPDLRSKFLRGFDSSRNRSINTQQEQQIGMHFHGTFMHGLADRFVQATGPTQGGGGGGGQPILSGSREFITKPMNVKPIGGGSGTLYDWISNGYRTGSQWEQWSQSSIQNWHTSYLFDQNDQLETEEYFSINGYNEYESLMGRQSSIDKRSFMQMTNWAMDQFITPFQNNDLRSMQYDAHFEWESNALDKLSDMNGVLTFNEQKDTRPENYAVVYLIKHSY